MLRQKMKRCGIIIYSYFWVKEFTKKGQRHLHILADMPEYVSQKWLSDAWRNITHGESYRVWINDTDIVNSAGYVMKYLTKVFGDDVRFERQEHRYGFCKHARSFVFPFTPILGDFWERIVSPCERPVFELEYHGGDYIGAPKKEFH